MKNKFFSMLAVLLVLALVFPAMSFSTVLAVVAPAAPSDLGATIMSASRVDLLWTDQSADETGFRIERSEDNFATAPSATFTGAIDQRTFSDPTVLQNHTYSYRVAAVNDAGPSAPSNTATVRVTNRLQVGPIDPASIFEGDRNTGWPGYYQDDEGTRVSLIPITPPAVFDPVDEGNPYSVFTGFGDEAFYWDASSVANTVSGRMVAVFALEAAYGGGAPAPHDEMVFTRIRIRADVPTPGIYTFLHPWGQDTIEVTQDDIDARGGMFVTEDIGITPRDFVAATTGRINRLLHQTVPPPPAGFIGDGGSVGPVTGSPIGFNKVRLVAPAGVNLDGAGRNFVESDQFTVSGRLLSALAPVPSFTKVLDPLNGVAAVTVTFADTSTNSPTAWLWDFGDGATSTEQNPFHTYDVAGNFTVRLTVTNAAGTAATSQVVSIFSRPVASFTKSVPGGIPPQTINFTDTSTGNPVSWLWDFGDGGSSTLQNPSHTYAAAGTFTITLTATNPAGSSLLVSQVLGISGTLVPGFTKTLSGVIAPVTVNVTDTSSGTITAWLWDFGDGTTSILQSPPAKVYDAAGNFTITLTVTDAVGSAATSQVVSVHSTPVASFTKSSDAGVPPLTVSFADTSAGNPTSWSWSFGDGTVSALPNPIKVYAAPGIYTVTLTVSNCAGSSSASQTVMVSTVFVGSSPLVLQVGSIDPNSIYLGNPNTGWPLYYQDDEGTRVALLPVTPPQAFDPPIPTNPYSVFIGFGDEAFYWDATSVSTTSVGRMVAVFAIEAAFGGGAPAPGDEMVFTRIRIRADVPSAGTYVFEHPWGQQTIEVTQDNIDSGRGIFVTSDIGAPRDFLVAASGGISRLLHQTIPPPPPGFIGDGGSVGPVTGSPIGFNAVRLTGPAGINLDGAGNNFVESDQFSVSGRLVTSLNAAFTMSAVSGTAPMTVDFTDTTTGGAPASFLWSFGDGVTDIAQNPSHTYDTAGEFIVTLTVTDAIGSASTTKTVSVFSVPVASFVKAPATAGVAPMTVRFTDTSTGNITCRFWDFGDGTSSTLPSQVKVYTVPGTYTVTLTVTNPAAVVSTSQTVTVLSTPPVPPTAPALLQPRNGAILTTVTPTLSWTTVRGALTYDVRITDVSRRSPPFVAEGIATNSFNVPAGALSAGTTYLWQVRAVNDFGASPFSGARTFRAPQGPPGPRLISPRSGSLLTNLTPQLAWSPVVGAITYDLQVSTNSRFESPVVQAIGLTDTSFDVLAGTLNGSTLYFWRVRVTTDLGTSRWSAANNFRTPLGPRTPPILDAPRGIAPSLTPTLRWHELRPEAVSFDVQISTNARFTATVLDQTGVLGTTLDVPAPLNARTLYFWRVRSVNQFGASAWRTGTFRTP